MADTPSKKADTDNEVAPSPEEENQTTEHPMEDPSTEVEVKEQDRWLPIANVARIMKSALPENAKIAKEAKECMQECVSEFISFITSEASEKCSQEKRKTVNGEDILFAMTSLGFENYSEALKIYLARYRETVIATSKPVGGASISTTAGANAGGAVAAGGFGEGEAGLTGEIDAADSEATGFAYNGNGTVDY